MTTNELVKQLLDLFQSFGIWVVFMWLYISEKKAHEATRESYRKDLREIAGFSANIRLNRPIGNESTKLPVNLE